ncbi:MAG: hypothetical protein V4735_06170 [Pseudomonadota bacterium]
MTNDPSERQIGPLNDSEEQERVRLAALRVGARGEGEPETATPTADAAQRKKNGSYQNYLFGNAGTTDAPAWSDSMSGRAAIRLVSRGIVGAAFFTWGGRIADRQLKGYSPETWDKSKPLQAIAKGIDTLLGKNILRATTGIGKMAGHSTAEATHLAEEALRFRGTRQFANEPKRGRSYGAEVVNFTFDFAMASVGDASTRNIIQAFDPNIKKPWLVNDNGEAATKGEHKHIDWHKWARSTAKTSWQVFSKNQGEDWAAAIPYAFQMKFQRQFLSNVFNKRFEGHKIAFDKNWNGGAYKVDTAGKVIGDYQLAGALDLHARFVGYNWYTLMYREGYDAVANGFTKWKDSGFSITPHVPDHFNPLTAAVDGVGTSLRYVTKSFIKANLYMNPAVVPFWLIRVPQSKWRSGTVTMHADGTSSLGHDDGNPIHGFHDAARYEHYPNETSFDKFETRFSKTLNWFGEKSYKLGTHAENFSDHLASKNIGPKIFKDKADRNKFMRQWVDASTSYTPYMWAKMETGLRVDDPQGKMDTAINGLIDNVASFNIQGAGKSLKQMWKLGTHIEHEITGREAGDPVEAKAPPAKLKAVPPATTVQASSLVRHDPALLAKADELARQDAANDPDMHDKRWAQIVSGGDYNPARIHPASPTRH